MTQSSADDSARNGEGSPDATPAMVDWEFAATVGAKLVAAPPKVTREEAAQVVADLRAGAARAAELVNDWCELGGEVGRAPLLVVDRPGWIRANVQTFSLLMDPLVERLTAKPPAKGVVHAVGSRVTGAEVGGLLGFLGNKVLGQFDPFHGEHGRLLLVAPNVAHVERELAVDPATFRLWVCLHEEAHRVQFTSVPWLADHIRGLMDEVTSQVDSSMLSPDNIKRVIEVVKGNGDRPSGGLAEALSSPAQRELLDRVTGVMSLLEGHADVVMDAVGTETLGEEKVREVRRKFNDRRKGVGTLDRLLRRLLGLEAKSAQYRDGYRFVEAAIEAVGKKGFNEVFARPENLPSKAEVLDPSLWLTRVHGLPAKAVEAAPEGEA